MEIGKILSGVIGVKKSLSDEEGEPQKLSQNSFIQIDKGERHCLIVLESWGLIAEVWQHTVPENLSDVDDIIRLQDDFGR